MATLEDIRRVRLLIPDTDAIYGDNEDENLFTDSDIEDFILLGNDSLKWAAGLAKIAVGGSEALILKVIRNYETTTDGANLMRQWTIAGQRLIEQGQAEWEIENSVDYFEITGPDHLRNLNQVAPEGTPLPSWLGY
jgi:hypothetical protein